MPCPPATTTTATSPRASAVLTLRDRLGRRGRIGLDGFDPVGVDGLLAAAHERLHQPVEQVEVERAQLALEPLPAGGVELVPEPQHALLAVFRQSRPQLTEAVVAHPATVPARSGRSRLSERVRRPGTPRSVMIAVISSRRG